MITFIWLLVSIGIVITISTLTRLNLFTAAITLSSLFSIYLLAVSFSSVPVPYPPSLPVDVYASVGDYVWAKEVGKDGPGRVYQWTLTPQERSDLAKNGPQRFSKGAKEGMAGGEDGLESEGRHHETIIPEYLKKN